MAGYDGESHYQLPVGGFFVFRHAITMPDERNRKEVVHLTKKQKQIIVFLAAFAAVFSIVPQVNAMHIMEGYLPIGGCVLWGVICIPFLAAGFFSIKRRVEQNRRSMIILAMSGAFVFVISSLKIPSVTGSCSHMTGTGMGALLFGPSAVSILGIIVLIFQAILLAHGGLTSLGANTFSMAIAGPFISFGLYKLCKKLKVNKSVSVFLAAALGDLFTYCVTSVQLAMAYPSAEGGVMASTLKFLGVFAPTQLPLAVVEGILTVVIINGLEKYADEELMDIGFIGESETVRLFNWKHVMAAVVAVVLIAAVPFLALRGAEFGGSDDAGSEMVAKIRGEEYEPWFSPVLETAIGGEIPGEIESLLFCVQTGIGVGILAFGYGRLAERKKIQKEIQTK